MDRRDIENVVRAAYAARQAGDLAATLSCFDPDAAFHVPGSPALEPLTLRVRGHAQLRPLLQHMIDVWDWSLFKIDSILIDGDTAVVLSKGQMIFRPTNTPVETQTCDILRIRGGKIVEFTEFCDTWAAAQVGGGAG